MDVLSSLVSLLSVCMGFTLPHQRKPQPKTPPSLIQGVRDGGQRRSVSFSFRRHSPSPVGNDAGIMKTMKPGGHAGPPLRGIFTSAENDTAMTAFFKKHRRLASRPYKVILHFPRL